jgi:hypothetical protein
MSRVTYKLTEAGDGRQFRVVGSGATLAAAKAEADSKLAMTVGAILSASQSEDIDAGDFGPVASAAGLFSDANLSLRNAAGQVVNIHLENVTTTIGTGTNGLIDLTDPLITGFATVYKDGAGNGGYLPYDGHFVS